MKTMFCTLAVVLAGWVGTRDSVSIVRAQLADTIYRGGAIVTIDDARPFAEAVAVRDGRIVAVGLEAEVQQWRGDKTRVVDLRGAAMLPGFVDAHGHVMGGGLQALSANLLAPPDGDVTDIPSLQQAVRVWIAENRAAVERTQLVIGFGYDPAQLKEQRHPTREDLDVISTELPIALVHQSGHLVAVNTKALELGGITADTPNPAGGVIQRRPGTQEPNGVLEETAAFPLLLKLISGVGAEGAATFLRAGAEMWASFGYTTAQDGRTMPSALPVLKGAAQAGQLKIDVVSYLDVLVDREVIKREYRADYSNRFRVAGAKLTIDGSPQGFTAWRDRPYYNPVGDYPAGYAGYPAVTAVQVIDAVDWAFEQQIQLLTHSNGEAASDLLITALRAATLKHGDADRRPVLIHGQFLREDQVDAFQRLNVIPSLFPMHTFYWGDWHRDRTVGPTMAENISPTGWCLERGMKFTSHHDAPVALPNSMRVLDATVTRRSRSGDIIGPGQCVDVLTALKAMTIWSAWQHFEETTKGSIEVGKLADFVILSQNPLQVDPETLDQIKVLETIKEDVTVFRRSAADKVGQQRRSGHFADRANESLTQMLLGISQTNTEPSTGRESWQSPERLGAIAEVSCSVCVCGALSQLSTIMIQATAADDHER